jgi:hypothetical protein
LPSLRLTRIDVSGHLRWGLIWAMV